MKCRTLSIALLLLGSATGCDRDRLAQFGTFAAAGTAYVRLLPLFTDEAGRAFLSADSATLIAARTIAGDQVYSHPELYTQSLTAQDAAMRQYLLNLQKVDAHAALLGAWFSGITALTDGKASAAAVKSLDGVLDAINQFNPQIETVSFGGQTVKSLLNTTGELVIARVEAKALDTELQRSAPVIDRALALQEAAVLALTQQMRASMEASSQGQENAAVIAPYLSTGPLPADWEQHRAMFLRRSVALTSANSAAVAIRSLHAGFQALVAHPSSPVDVSALLRAMGEMAGAAKAASAQ